MEAVPGFDPPPVGSGKLSLTFPINPYSVVFEFARQLVQLRETNSITETTFAQFARQVLAWLNRVLKNLRIVANSLDSEGGVFDGTAFQSMVLEMEKQMRALNERMSRMLAADEEAAPVDTFFVDPFRRCAHRNGWHH